MDAHALIQAIMELWGCVFCLIALVAMSTKENKKKTRADHLLSLMHLCTLILLFADGMAWLFRGQSGVIAGCMVHVSNFVVFVIGYVTLALYTGYVSCKLPARDARKSRYWFYLVYLLSAIASLLMVVNIFTHWFYTFDTGNRYYRAEWFFLTQLAGIVGAVVNGAVLVKYRKKLQRRDLIAMAMYIVLPLIAMVIQIFVYGIAFLNIAITIAMLSMFMVSIRHNYEDIAVKEKELSDLKVQALISQISPHFIYNSLNTIKFLCTKDPAVAGTAVDELSGFLRGNLDVLEEQNCIPIEREMNHVQNYLLLEKRRFKDRLNVVWNLEGGRFLIPPMTLQPLVENAVKHGITQRLEGGTLTITTQTDETSHYVIIEDDGVGFDQSSTSPEPPENEMTVRDGNRKRPHIGIKNAKNRLELMCGGSLQIQSTIGTGTRAVITLPVKEEAFTTE